MKNKILFFITLSIFPFFLCQSPENAKKNIGVKYLHIIADIPDNLFIKVQINFRSIPIFCGCKSLSEQSWNWVPLESREDYTISKMDREICVPLYINKKTVCKWNLYDAEIGIAAKSDKLGITGFSIYPKADTTLVLKYEKLTDTLRYNCYRLTNQYTSPKEIFFECEKLNHNNEDDPYYTFEELHADTAHVTVIAHNDSGPIRYLDTTLPVRNQYRVFGKNEKIPGLNEARK